MQDLTPISALTAELAELKPGHEVSVVVTDQNGRKATLQVTLGTYPGD